jgi:deoxyadenosine/deoxycytidine kinase
MPRPPRRRKPGTRRSRATLSARSLRIAPLARRRDPTQAPPEAMTRKRPQADAPRLIAIEGPTGVGKTALARHLARRLDARLVLEDIDGNPFLRDFHREPRRAAFQTQMYFLLSRYQQQQDLRQGELFVRNTVTDYLFRKDRLFAYLTLGEAELTLYDRIFGLLEPRTPRPDLVVYLKARPEVLLERVRARSGDPERPVDLEQLERVVAAYNDFFFRWEGSPLLVVNASDVDLAEREAHLDDVVSAIRRMRKGVQHHDPVSTRR